MDEDAARDGKIRDRLVAFCSHHWPVVEHLAVFISGRRLIEVSGPAQHVQRPVQPLKPIGHDAAWGRAIEYLEGTDVLVLPTTDAAIVLIKIDAVATLVIDCAEARRIGVICTLGRNLASELQVILSAE